MRATLDGSHTPGPWEFRFSEMGGYDCMTDALVVGKAGSPFSHLADLDLSDYGQPRCGTIPPAMKTEAEANARLIAAAPEMLAALKGCIEASDKFRAEHNVATESECLIAVRAAIAKAEVK